MNIKNLFLSLILLIFMILSQNNFVVATGGGVQEIITSVETQEDKLNFTLQVPWESLRIEEVMVEGIIYTEVVFPGWQSLSAQGEPVLPYWQEMIGLPFGAEVEISVNLGKAHTTDISYPVRPGVTQKVNWDEPTQLYNMEGVPEQEVYLEMNPEIYRSTSAFPGEFGRLNSDGVLRQQRVAGVALFPVQYRPMDNQIVVYETLEIEISFSNFSRIQTQILEQDSIIFEHILNESLMNYDQSRSWRGSWLDIINSADQLEGEGSIITSTDWSPPDQGWRIEIEEEGIYQITYGELEAAGLPVETLNPNTLQMFNLGEEVAIAFWGDSDNLFESDEKIVFYGQAYSNKYTDKNIYWLTYGNAIGLRMTNRDVTPGSAPIAGSYDVQKYFEENHYYSSSVPGEDHLERFLWAFIKANSSAPARWTYSFPASEPLDGSGTVKLSLLGYIENSINPDHHVVIYLDNDVITETQIGEVWWDGVTWQNLELTIPSGLLIDGENTLIVECVNDTGVTYDRVYIEAFEINYPGGFKAEGNQLKFNYGQTGSWLFQITGFSSSPQSVYDISDPRNVITLGNFEVTGSGDFTLTLEDDLNNLVHYWAAGEGTMRNVASIISDNPSVLISETNQADYILIAPELFTESAEALRDYRQTQGLETVLVELQDIYDEFNYGITDVRAIHDFLQYAYQYWASPAPTFVVLIGDGHYDPMDYLGEGRESFMPPYLAVVDPWIGETASDNRYVTVSGDDKLPDMIIGRLSVNNAQELSNMIDKIVHYEQSTEPGDWLKKILAVADDADSGGNFPQYSDEIMDEFVQPPYSVEEVYYGITHSTEDSARAAIQNYYNNGAVLINFIGHAYYTGWADEDLLTTTDIPLLQNGEKQPIVLAMTCYEGFFHRPYALGGNFEALGEVVTRAVDRGAIASWSPTGLGIATGHDLLNRGFIEAFLIEKVDTVGEATLAGKLDLWASDNNLDLLDTYMLFGDPALNFFRTFLAVVDSYQTNEDSVLNVSVDQGLLANDSYPQGVSVTAELVDDVQNGTLNLNSNGSLTYSPDTNWFGVDSFTYRLFDGQVYSNTATVTINVFAVNDPPIAIAQSLATDIDTPIGIELTATDDGTGSSGPFNEGPLDSAVLTYEIVSGPSNGTLENFDLPFLTYQPAPGFIGVDQFSFKVNDGEFDSNTAIITIQVGDGFTLYFPLIIR